MEKEVNQMALWTPEAYLEALHFSAEAHAGQFYVGSDKPFVIHPCMVCAEVMKALAYEDFAQPDLAVQCALLHDTLEDTPVTLDQLEQTFGVAVARGVQALTKNESLAKLEQMGDSLRRIQAQPKEVWLVKLADRITNLQAPPVFWDTEKIRAYQAEAQQILQALALASPYLGQRLADKIAAYTAFIP